LSLFLSVNDPTDFFPKGNEIYEIPWQIPWGRFEASNGYFCKNLMIPFPNLMNHQIVRPFLAILLPIPDWWSLLGLSSHCDGDLVL